MNLKEMEARGIMFSVNGLNGGFFDLPTDEVPAFLADEPGWYARAYEVSREQIQAFQQLVDSEFQCRAMTKRGTRCTGMVDCSSHLSPRDYEPERDGYCFRHRTLASQGPRDCVPGVQTTVFPRTQNCVPEITPR